MKPVAAHRQNDDAGFTLLAVVAVVLLLSIVVLTLMKSASSVMYAARAAADRAAAVELADGMMRLVGRHLSLSPMLDDASGNLPVTGLPAYCTQSKAMVAITVAPANGQIDLNTASAELIAYTLKGAGLSEDDAQRITTAIVDYRTLGDGSLNGESKAAQYAASELTFGPKTALFASVDELDQLPGMTRKLFQVIAPLFTVRSGLRSVETRRASYPVVLSLRGTGLSSKDPFPSAVEFSQWRQEIVLPETLKPPTKTRSTKALRAPPLDIEVTVWTPSGARFTRKATAAVTTGSGDVTRFLDWSETDTRERLPAASRSAVLPPCLGELLWINK